MRSAIDLLSHFLDLLRFSPPCFRRFSRFVNFVVSLGRLLFLFLSCAFSLLAVVCLQIDMPLQFTPLYEEFRAHVDAAEGG